MTSAEFVQKLIEIPQKYKTAYASGTFGQQATNGTIDSKAKQYPKWYTASRVKTLKALPDDTRLFDCCGLIKAVLWGFPNTVYTSNGVPDKNDQGLWDVCTDKSQSFAQIQPGEMVWMQGHVGVYIGEGKAIECTASWGSKVMITAVANMGSIAGLNSRRWTGHGKLPYVTYTTPQATPVPSKTDKKPVIKKGSKGESVKELKELLTKKGYAPFDSTFGDECDAAVRKFQRENTDTEGKKLAVDGCVGPKTWGALYK